MRLHLVSTPRRRIVAVGAAALIAVALTVVLTRDGSPDVDDDPTETTNSSASAAPTGRDGSTTSTESTESAESTSTTAADSVEQGPDDQGFAAGPTTTGVPAQPVPAFPATPPAQPNIPVVTLPPEQSQPGRAAWLCSAPRGQLGWACTGPVDGVDGNWNCLGSQSKGWDCVGTLGAAQARWSCTGPGETSTCLGSIGSFSGSFGCTYPTGTIRCTVEAGSTSGTWEDGATGAGYLGNLVMNGSNGQLIRSLAVQLAVAGLPHAPLIGT